MKVSDYLNRIQQARTMGKPYEKLILALQKKTATSKKAAQEYADICGGIYTAEAIMAMSKAALEASRKAKEAEAYAKAHPI